MALLQSIVMTALLYAASRACSRAADYVRPCSIWASRALRWQALVVRLGLVLLISGGILGNQTLLIALSAFAGQHQLVFTAMGCLFGAMLGSQFFGQEAHCFSDGRNARLFPVLIGHICYYRSVEADCQSKAENDP